MWRDSRVQPVHLQQRREGCNSMKQQQHTLTVFTNRLLASVHMDSAQQIVIYMPFACSLRVGMAVAQQSSELLVCPAFDIASNDLAAVDCLACYAVDRQRYPASSLKDEQLAVNCSLIRLAALACAIVEGESFGGDFHHLDAITTICTHSCCFYRVFESFESPPGGAQDG